jgi:hypothetical protein
MTANGKTLHILADEWIALSAHLIRTGLLIVGEQLSGCSQWAHARIVEDRWTAVFKKLLIRQKEVRLLADPLEPTVLLDDKRRLVGANQAALSLLGVSERNINKFTIDAFLSFGESGPKRMERSFIKKSERWRGCKIIRLDGSSMVGEFVFQANVAPGRHLSKFRKVKSCRHVPSQMPSKLGIGLN